MALNLIAPFTRAMAAIKVRFGDPVRRFGHFGRGAAGVAVTHDNAEQVAAVWACMDVIASALSSSDWNVYAGVRNASNKQDLPDDALQYILNTRFNPEMTAQAGKRALGLAAVGYGAGYAEIEYDLAGRIVNLWPIAPNRVNPRRDVETGRLFYRVSQEFGGGFVDLDPEDLFIIRGASLVGFAGDDPIARGVQSISTAIALDQYAAGFFGNGAQLGTVFTYKGKLDDAHYTRVKEQIEQRHTGVKNAFRSGFFEGNGEWDVHEMGSDAEKSQLVDVKYLSIEEICRMFRVPPHKIAHLLRATNNNIEHQGLEFSRDTLRPWVKEIEQEADYKLIPYRGPRKFVEIDVDWAEQGDYKSRASAYQILRACGVFSPNMVLRKLGENTIGPKGDVFTMNGATMRLEDVGKNMLPSAPPGTPGDQTAADESAANAMLTDWLTSIFNRVDTRHQQARLNFRKANRPDWEAAARTTAQNYVEDKLDEMGAWIDEYRIAAMELAEQVIDGDATATEAARAVLESK